MLHLKCIPKSYLPLSCEKNFNYPLRFKGKIQLGKKKNNTTTVNWLSQMSVSAVTEGKMWKCVSSIHFLLQYLVEAAYKNH